MVCNEPSVLLKGLQLVSSLIACHPSAEDPEWGDHIAFTFIFLVFRARTEKGSTVLMPDWLSPVGCLGLRNCSPLCMAKHFPSVLWWMSVPITWRWFCATVVLEFLWLSMVLALLGICHCYPWFCALERHGDSSDLQLADALTLHKVGLLQQSWLYP